VVSAAAADSAMSLVSMALTAASPIGAPNQPWAVMVPAKPSSACK
jgi:hypothetical protein